MPASHFITLQDRDAGSLAVIAADFGFNCFRFETMHGRRSLDVLWAEEGFETGKKRPSGSGIPILFPFPGRLQGTSMTYGGRTFPLAAGDGRGNAIHGFVLDRPWRIVEETAEHATGEFHAARDDRRLLDHWPADFRIAVTYALSGRRLTITAEIDNPDDRPLPWGLGLHPYFCVPLGGPTADDCRLTVPAASAWELNEMIPSGRKQPAAESVDLAGGARFGDLQLDNVFGDLTFRGGNCTSRLEDPASGRGIKMSWDESFGVCVVYNPPHRQSVCIEPYTCVPGTRGPEQTPFDAGWRLLEPGESVVMSVVIEVE